MNLKSLPKKVKNALVTIKDFCIKQLNMSNNDSEYCLNARSMMMNIMNVTLE